MNKCRNGVPWRYVSGDFLAWPAVYQQLSRWLEARCFKSRVDDLRQLLRTAQGRPAEPLAVLLDNCPLQSTPESGHRTGYDGAKRRKGSKVHIAVDTPGHLLAALVTPANEQGRV
ncbi:transposase [Hymenobacter negativus]|uniref:Transposase n=1 Tax=Hymenobacter negativus TaxID=2795026 RepID=A0ABS3QEE8_9BACT|nr:transposase [Hymenobacter negativus]